MMRKIILLLWFAIPLFCMAQNSLSVEYDYDATGNRTSRRVIIMQAPPDDAMAITLGFPESEPEPEYFEDRIAQMKMKVYPNPATERITLEISNMEDVQTGIFKLFSLSGQLLQEQPVYSAITTISLASLAKGAYILKVRINDHTEDLKIIKQ
jgi:hypothetical protein